MSEYKIHIGTGDDRKTYVLDRDSLLNTEAIAIEAATGRTLLDVFNGLPEVSMISITALVWILRRRDEPGLQFGDVQFAISELDLEDPEAETVPKDEPAPEPS